MNRARSLTLAATLALTLAPALARDASAACPEPAYNGVELCNSAMNTLIEKATGPGLGADGPSLPTIHNGCNNPKPVTSVPFDMPCVLLKAIGLTESSWQQFDVNACGQTGPTLISFDCGYGVMQITSGMDGTAGFNPTRVAKETAYNIGTGMKILGGKWAATPCVGDNEVAVMEDWYYAVWAYNGFCYCNNPNNSKFPSPRPPFNGPGTLSRGSYPYQEIVWGLVQYPYSNTYSGQPISYPSKAAIGQNAAKIPAPSPTHSGACAPVVPAHPDLYPSIAVESLEDRFADGASAGIVDAIEKAGFTAQLYVKNQGDGVAKNVQIGVWIEEPFVAAQGYQIETDWTHPGEFTPNDANDHPDNPPHTAAPGQAFTLHLYALSPGETKRVTLDMIAKEYSIGLADSPDVRFWVKDVTGFYHQDDFNGEVTNEGDYQTFGDKLQVYAPTDIYSATRWEWNTDRFEGFTAGGGASVAIDLEEQALVITSDGADPMAVGPSTAFEAAAYKSITMRAKRTGGEGEGAVYFTTEADAALDEAKKFTFDLPDDGAWHDIAIGTDSAAWTGTITQLRVDPFESGKGEVLLDYLRVVTSSADTTSSSGPGAGADPGPGPGSSASASGGAAAPADLAEDAGGCGCRTAGTGTPGTGPAAAALLALLALARRRRATQSS